MADGCVPFYLVVEDEVHRALAMALVDRVIAESCIDRSPTDAHRWSALRERDDVPPNRRFNDIHRPAVKRIHGFIAGQPPEPAARKFREKLVEHARSVGTSAVVVLMQDTDGDPRIKQGALQVLEWASTRSDLPPCAIGTPHCDAEAWFMAVPDRSPKESSRLRKAAFILNFDPSNEPERLTSKPNQRISDAKRVVRYIFLEEGSELREGVPKSKSPSPEEADTLARRVASNLLRLDMFDACGLTAFLIQLRAAVSRAFCGGAPTS